jgi:hypothetical protein
MNKLQQEKIAELRACRMGWGTWDADYINSLAALLKVDAKAPLSGRQQYMLDLLVYRYRRQLAGHVSFDLPEEAPKEADYVRETAGQGVLFT